MYRTNSGPSRAGISKLFLPASTPEILNQALHPISVILENNAYNQTLEALLEEQGVNSVPKLPQELSVLVFAGQHRLAMLSQLDLGGQENMWWHAHVYKQVKN
ncbi:hypothetical protein RhiTH_009577 [Rhizoctonia solani]